MQTLQPRLLTLFRPGMFWSTTEITREESALRFNLLHCWGFVDMLSTNEHARISACISIINKEMLTYRPLYKWRLYLNNNTYTSLASLSWEKPFFSSNMGIRCVKYCYSNLDAIYAKVYVQSVVFTHCFGFLSSNENRFETNDRKKVMWSDTHTANGYVWIIYFCQSQRNGSKTRSQRLKKEMHVCFFVCMEIWRKLKGRIHEKLA